ncbi:MAG: GatB/YqeY domain-containing protein [bacterium]
MTIQEQIKKDVLEAFKNKDSEKSSTLRMLQAALKNKEIEVGKDKMTDEISLEIIAREARRRKEAIESFEKGNRPDLAEKEKREAEILAVYLPRQISDEEIELAVKEVISQTGISDKKDIGKAMGEAMKKLKGKADGTRIRQIVEKNLQ